MIYYAGIGSRETPTDILEMMEMIAYCFRVNEGWTLRSGHAQGADQAFERGALDEAEIFLPWAAFCSDVPIITRTFYENPAAAAYNLAARYHPNWFGCTPAGKRLHARNTHQVLGWDLSTPVNQVVCWTPYGKGGGGTGQAIRVAKDYRIPVWDLAVPSSRMIFTNYLDRWDLL